MARPSAKSIQGKIANASRADKQTPQRELDALYRDYRATKIAEYVEREVAKAPSLTPEQIAIISRALNRPAE